MSSRAQRSKLHDRGDCFVASLLTRKSWPTGRKIRRNSGSFLHGGRPTGRWELAMTGGGAPRNDGGRRSSRRQSALRGALIVKGASRLSAKGLVDRILQPFADLEPHRGGGGDLHFLAGARIATGACLAFGGDEGAKARQANLVLSLQCRGDGGQHGVDGIPCFGAGQIGALGDRSNKVVLVHLCDSPSYMIKRTTRHRARGSGREDETMPPLPLPKRWPSFS